MTGTGEGPTAVTGGRFAGKVALVTGAGSGIGAAAARRLATYGRLDVAFNNAGTTAASGPTDRLEVTAWQAELDANLTSVFLCLKHEIAAVSDGGAILNNASIAAVSGTPTLAAYTAAKHGVLGLTRSTALELVDRGVRVNALITGNVDTPLYRRLSGLGPHDALPPAPNPTGRTATTEEIASFVAYLLSDETTFITCAALTADGGFTAS